MGEGGGWILTFKSGTPLHWLPGFWGLSSQSFPCHLNVTVNLADQSFNVGEITLLSNVPINENINIAPIEIIKKPIINVHFSRFRGILVEIIVPIAHHHLKTIAQRFNSAPSIKHTIRQK